MLLAMLLAYQVSILAWQIIPQPELRSGERPQQLAIHSSQSQTTLTSQQKTAQIAEAYLFGRPESSAPQPAKVEDAPKSSLNYKLRGIYYSRDQSLASVILQKNALASKFYRLGDEVDTNIIIHQIQPNHIIISRQGRLEKLVLEKPTADMTGGNRKQAISNLPVSTSAKVLKSYRRRYKDNPLALAKRFQAIPVQENGKNIGYKLKALRGERLLQQLNMQKDDVFVAINGIGLDKPFQALDALKSLTTAESVSVTVMRNGNRETLDFNLQ